LRGWEEYEQLETMLWRAFPDFHEINEDIIAKGEKVWFLEKVTGTASSGKKMDATALTILRIVNS